MQALERAVAWTATALKIDFGPQAKGRIGINEIDVVVAAVVVGVAEADVDSYVAVAVAAVGGCIDCCTKCCCCCC